MSACVARRERELAGVVRRAYECHARNDAVLPSNLFLRFGDGSSNRIIAKAAYLDDPFHVAGMKWISSFPENTRAGLERASGIIVLNSVRTGRPEILMEGSVVNARRTAASAALAADVLLTRLPDSVAFVGAGPIAFETLRHLVVAGMNPRSVRVMDLQPERAAVFAQRVRAEYPGMVVGTGGRLEEVTRTSQLVCFATSAQEPFVDDPALFAPGALVLNISLRDLSPAVVLSGVNIVDDIDHVCSAGTSLDMTERECGDRAFIRGTLGDILRGTATAPDANPFVVFSPFGLAALDVAVAHWVAQLALEAGEYSSLPGFVAPTLMDDVSSQNEVATGAAQT